MAQHQRLSPKVRRISLPVVAGMPETEIADYFANLRWGSRREQGCPKCGVFDAHYQRRRRRRTSRRPSSSWDAPTNPTWQCKHCQAVFSVTSGTLFDHTKLPLRTLLNGAVLFLGPGNGASALSVSGLSGLSYKSAFLLGHRFREAMAADQPNQPFDGIVQMDGGYFCGKPHKPNRRQPRATKLQLQRRFGKMPVEPATMPWQAMGMTQSNWRKMANKRVVLAVTRSGSTIGDGSSAVAVAVARGGENEYSVRLMASAHIKPNSVVMTDESGAYNQLCQHYEHYTVSHSREFCSSEGINDNHCEAFFSRMRRAEYGIYHGYRPTFLHFYASEMAWRHTHRRLCKAEQVSRLLMKALAMGPSSRLRGYYAQRGYRSEVLIDSSATPTNRQ